jgi:hypothetical protein
MFVRQSIIRRGTATREHVIDGLAAWITALFDLGNLRTDRGRAIEPSATISSDAVDRLARAPSNRVSRLAFVPPEEYRMR